MLRSLKSFQTHAIEATDGDIGQVHDFLFDDTSWIIRYLVVDTSRWLPGRKVLISAQEIKPSHPIPAALPVDLTREEVKSSPDIDTDQPVSRQYQQALHRHYGWPYYWMNPAGMPQAMAGVPVAPPLIKPETKENEPGDPHLRSAKEVEGYRIEASDGRLGHVEDLIGDDTDWTIRYFVVDTRNWLPGKKVLVSPEWKVGNFNWSEKSLTIDLSRAKIKACPEYDPDSQINRAYEIQLYDYYGRPAYWAASEELAAKK